jgi:hypothetical protein
MGLEGVVLPAPAISHGLRVGHGVESRLVEEFIPETDVKRLRYLSGKLSTRGA